MMIHLMHILLTRSRSGMEWKERTVRSRSRLVATTIADLEIEGARLRLLALASKVQDLGHESSLSSCAG
jgi:hypothetical protein